MGNLNQSAAVDNLQVIFWGVRDLLRIDVVCKPLGRDCHGGAAILDKDAVVPLIPGRSHSDPIKMGDHLSQRKLDLFWQVIKGKS